MPDTGINLSRLKKEIGDSEWVMLKQEEVQWLIFRIEMLESGITDQIRTIIGEIEIREAAVGELLAQNTRLENALRSILEVTNGQSYDSSHARQMFQIARDALGTVQRAQ